MEPPDGNLVIRLRQLARFPLLLGVLLLWIPLSACSLLLLLLPRRRARVSPPEQLTVVAPYSPGNQSGGAQAIAGLMSCLEGRFSTRLVDLSKQKDPGDIWSALAYGLTFPLPVPDHCRRLLLSPRSLMNMLDESGRVLIEFPGPGLFLLMSRRPGYRVVMRDHEVLLRKLAMEYRAAVGLWATLRQFFAVGICYLVGLALYSRLDSVITLTDEDRQCLERWYPFLRSRVRTLPIHFECSGDPPRRTVSTSSRELLFVGNFFHQPNVDALIWFLQEVGPGLEAGFKLHLCGLDGPLDHVSLENPHVQVLRHGFVDDMEEQFQHVGIALAPIVSGGGVRVKNLHLACLGKAIVSTPLGNEGIGFADDIHAVIAANGADMARRLNSLAHSPDKISLLGRAAREFVQQRFDKGVLAAGLEDAIRGSDRGQ